MQLSSKQQLFVDQISAFDQCSKSKSHYDYVLGIYTVFGTCCLFISKSRIQDFFLVLTNSVTIQLQKRKQFTLQWQYKNFRSLLSFVHSPPLYSILFVALCYHDVQLRLSISRGLDFCLSKFFPFQSSLSERHRHSSVTLY